MASLLFPSAASVAQRPLVTSLLLASFPSHGVTTQTALPSAQLSAVALTGVDGIALSGDFAVARHISKALGLYPTDSAVQSTVEQWVDLAVWIFATCNASGDALAAVDAFLSSHNFLAGHSLTFADVALAAVLAQFPADPKFGNVTRWFASLNVLLKFDAAADVLAAAKVVEPKKKAAAASGKAAAPAAAAAVPPPAAAPVAKSAAAAPAADDAVTKQGNLVRELKAAKAPKAEIDAAVEVLKQLKAAAGTAPVAAPAATPVAKPAAPAPAAAPKKTKEPKEPKDAAAAKPARGKADKAEAATGGAGELKSTGGLPPLPGAVEGAVVTRFPPEPSGYLHLGHVKAVMLNEHYARFYKGKLLVRFDDTNPSKESQEFATSIIHDLGTLGIVPDMVSHTSDHFDLIADFARQIIKDGLAYMDDTPVEQMRLERGECVESKRRTLSVEANLAQFEKLWQGIEPEWCLRAKIDMSSVNGCMRDPVLFRYNADPHLRTGTKYKAYPTYDFACPIVDSIEGVTHAMRTLEYKDRDAQFEWIQNALRLRPVTIVEFSRLNFQYTLLSKRRLTWFVEQGVVDGWMDPRFPTVAGMLRRGLLVQNLREFMISQGASKRVVDMEWDKVWSNNARMLDPVTPRYMAVGTATAVPLRLLSGDGLPTSVEGRSVPLHDKNAELGVKVMQYASTVLLERDDAESFDDGEEFTLMKWGNVILTNKLRDAAGNLTGLEATLNVAGDFKKTKKKITWIAQSEDTIPVHVVEFDFLITKPKMEDTDDFMSFVNPSSKAETLCTGEMAMVNIKENDMIQIMRRGYFRCDRPYRGEHSPLVLFQIPDGKQKAMSTLSTKLSHR